MKCVMSQMTALYISAHFTEREGDQAGTVAEDRRQREQMLALSQVEADSPLLLCWKRIEIDKRQLQTGTVVQVLARQVMEKSRVVAGQQGARE